MQPLEPRDFVADYAAVVATATLGWQVWSSHRAKRPRVALLLDTWRSSQAANRRTLESAEVRIRNHEDYAVRVVGCTSDTTFRFLYLKNRSEQKSRPAT